MMSEYLRVTPLVHSAKALGEDCAHNNRYCADHRETARRFLGKISPFDVSFNNLVRKIDSFLGYLGVDQQFSIERFKKDFYTRSRSYSTIKTLIDWTKPELIDNNFRDITEKFSSQEKSNIYKRNFYKRNLDGMKRALKHTNNTIHNAAITWRDEIDTIEEDCCDCPSGEIV